MAKYFTIGETAKFFQITTKTLRYYEQKELLYPEFVDKNNRYRYYSDNQLLTLDLIQWLKKTGMPISKIKECISKNYSSDFIVEAINQQIEILHNKVEEISKIKNHLKVVTESISDICTYPCGQVVIRHNKERKIIKFLSHFYNEEEREAYFRAVIKHIEEKFQEVYPLLAGCVTYEDAREGNFNYQHVQYIQRFFEEDSKKFLKTLKTAKMEIVAKDDILPSGDYVGIVFDTNYRNIASCYEKIFNYLSENSLQALGDFNEVWIMPRVDEKGNTVIFGIVEIMVCLNKEKN